MRLRRLAIGLGIGLAILVVIAAIGWFAVLPAIVERIAVDRLRDEGIPVERLRLAQLGLGGAVVEDVSLAGGRIAVQGIAIGFDPWDLMSNARVESVVIRGAVLRIGIDAGGRLDIPRYTVASGGGGGALPVDRIAVYDSEIVIDSPYGTIRAPVSAEVDVAASGETYVRGRLEPSGAGAAGIVPFDVRQASDGTLSGGLQLTDASFVSPDLTAEGVTGWATVAGTVVDAKLQGAVEVERLVRGDVAVRNAALLIGGTPDRIDWLMGKGEMPGTARVWFDLRSGGASGTSIALDVQAQDLAALAAALGSADLGVSGEASLRGSLSMVSAGIDAVSSLIELQLGGVIQVSAADVAVAGVIGEASLELGARVAIDQGSIMLTGTEDWRLTGRAGEAGEVPVDLVWRPGPAKPHRATLVPEGGPWRLGLFGGVAGGIAGVDFTGDMAAEMVVGGDEPAQVRLTRAALDVAPVPIGGLVLDPGRINATAAVTDTGFEARLTGQSAVWTGSGSGAVLTGTVELRTEGPVLQVRAPACLVLSAGPEAFGGAVRLVAPIAVSACAAGDLPIIAVDLAGPAEPVIALAIPGFQTAVATEGGATADFTVTTPALHIATGADGTVAITGTGGKLDYDGAGLRADGIDLATSWDPGAADLPILGVTAARIAFDGEPIVPVRGDGQVRFDAETGEIVAEGTLHDLRDRASARYTARHALASGTGGIDLDLAPISLRAEGLQPRDIVPALVDLPLRRVSGRLTGEARLGWGGGDEFSGRFTLADGGFVSPYGTASGVRADLSIDRLSPLRLPAGQRLRIAQFDVGTILENVDARFGWREGGRVDVGEAGFDWGGGRITMSSFSTATLDREPARITVTGVHLGRVLAEAAVAGLEITGQVSGAIPFRLDGDNIVIDDAVLETTGPGVIRYAPSEPPSFAAGGDSSVELLMSALRNFQYESLRMTIDGSTAEEAVVQLGIRGANPDLYDGYPISLNINLSGALYSIIEQSLDTARLDDRARDYLERQSRRLFAP